MKRKITRMILCVLLAALVFIPACSSPACAFFTDVQDRFDSGTEYVISTVTCEGDIPDGYTAEQVAGTIKSAFLSKLFAYTKKSGNIEFWYNQQYYKSVSLECYITNAERQTSTQQSARVVGETVVRIDVWQGDSYNFTSTMTFVKK